MLKSHVVLKCHTLSYALNWKFMYDAHGKNKEMAAKVDEMSGKSSMSLDLYEGPSLSSSSRSDD